MPKFWTPFFSGQSLLLSATVLNDNNNGHGLSNEAHHWKPV